MGPKGGGGGVGDPPGGHVGGGRVFKVGMVSSTGM